MVRLSNGVDLPDVMASVNQMKPAPLVNAERSENPVGDAATGAEETFGFAEKGVHSRQMMGGEVGEIAAADWWAGLRSDLSRGLATTGHDAQGS